MFKTEAIILSIDTVRDNNIRIVVLAKEYGKISCWYKKKQFPHDIGDIIFLTVERNNSTNTIKYTESVMSPREESWNYTKITTFLESLALMYTLLPEMSPYLSVFQDYRWLLLHMQSRTTLHAHHYLLFQFRVLRTLGYIGAEGLHGAVVPLYIFEHVLTTPLTQLLSAKVLRDTDARTIEIANKEAIYRSTL